LTDDSFDVCIRFGAPPDAPVIAGRTAPNQRLLFAERPPAEHSTPGVPND
jgi:LysR family transcriptional activator of dmlA